MAPSSGLEWAERTQRFGKLLARLRQDDYPSPKLLGKWLGKCPKTIQRDLLHMRDNMHCPIDYDYSRKGWYLTNKAYILPLAFASKQDLQAIIVLGELVAQYANTPLGKSMQQAFTRLLELFKGNEDDIAKIREFTRRVCFAGAPPSRAMPKVWETILKALQTDQRLEIEYCKGGKEKPLWRKIDPYGLIVRNRDWFLRAYCHVKNKPLTFFVPYITNVRLLKDEFFNLPPDFDLAAYIREGFMGVQGNKSCKVVLRFDPDAAGAAESAPFTPDQVIKREPSGHLLVTFTTNALFQVRRELARWDAGVEILEPAELRKEMSDCARRVLAKYGKR